MQQFVFRAEEVRFDRLCYNVTVINQVNLENFLSCLVDFLWAFKVAWNVLQYSYLGTYLHSGFTRMIRWGLLKANFQI